MYITYYLISFNQQILFAVYTTYETFSMGVTDTKKPFL